MILEAFVRVPADAANSQTMLTDGVGSDGVCVHTEKRDSDERTIPPQPKNGITQLKCGVMLVGIPLVKVDVWVVLDLDYCATKSVLDVRKCHSL